MLGKNAKVVASKDIHNRTVLVIPKTAEEISREVSSKLSEVVIPSNTPKDAVRKLTICLSANLSAFILRHSDVDRSYFKKTDNNQYELTDYAKNEFGGLDVVNRMPKETLRLLAETICSNAKTPIWVEGFQMEKEYYLMVIRNFDVDLFNAVTRSEAVQLTVNIDKAGRRTMKELNSLAALESKTIHLISKRAAIEQSHASAIKRIGEHASAIRETIQIAKKMDESKDDSSQTVLRQTERYLDTLLQGKLYMSAKGFAKAAAGTSGVSAEEFENKVRFSPFSAIEPSGSSIAVLDATMSSMLISPSLPLSTTIEVKPIQVSVDPRMRRSNNSSDRRSNLTQEEREIIQKITNCRTKNLQMADEDVALAIDLGWEYNKQSKGFNHPRFTSNPIVRANLVHFFKSNTWARLRNAAEGEKKNPPPMTFAEEKIFDLSNKIYELESKDSHKLSEAEVNTRFAAMVSFAFSADVDGICISIKASDIMNVWASVRLSSNLFAPPFSLIVEAVFNLVYTQVEQKILTSEVYLAAKKTTRMEVSEERAKKMVRNLVSSRVTYYFESGNCDSFIGQLVLFNVCGMTALSYARKSKGHPSFSNSTAANVIASLVRRIPKQNNPQDMFKLKDYEMLANLEETLTFEKPGSLNAAYLVEKGNNINLMIKNFIDLKWQEAIQAINNPTLFAEGEIGSYVACASALPMIDFFFKSRDCYGYPRGIAYAGFLAFILIVCESLPKYFELMADDLLASAKTVGIINTVDSHKKTVEFVKTIILALFGSAEAKDSIKNMTQELVQKPPAQLKPRELASILLASNTQSLNASKLINYIIRLGLVPNEITKVLSFIDPGNYLSGNISIRGVIPPNFSAPVGFYPGNIVNFTKITLNQTQTAEFIKILG